MRTEGPSNLVTLNQENPVTVARKRVENLALLNESGIVESLEQHHKGSTIILFGSYARGEDTIKSDIDIAIIGAKQDSTDSATYEKYLERPINIQTYKDKKAIDSFVQTNIHNGIILSGGWQ